MHRNAVMNGSGFLLKQKKEIELLVDVFPLASSKGGLMLCSASDLGRQLESHEAFEHYRITGCHRALKGP